MTTGYFVGVWAVVFAVPVECFAFFFFAFLVPVVAGVAGFAAPVEAGGEVGVVPSASVATEKAAIASAATKCLIDSILVGS